MLLRESRVLPERCAGGEDAGELAGGSLQLGWMEAHLSGKAAVPRCPGSLPQELPQSEAPCSCVTPVSPSRV